MNWEIPSGKKIEMPDFNAGATRLADLARYPEPIQQQVLANLLAERGVGGTFARRIINAIVGAGAGATAPAWDASDALTTKAGADAQAVARAFYGESAKQAKGSTYNASENVFAIVIDTAARKLQDTAYDVDDAYLRMNTVMQEARAEINDSAHWRTFSGELVRILNLPPANILTELNTSRTTGAISGILPVTNPISRDVQDAIEEYVQSDNARVPSNRQRAIHGLLQNARGDISSFLGIQQRAAQQESAPPAVGGSPAQPEQFGFRTNASPVAASATAERDLSWRVPDDVRDVLNTIARDIETQYGRGVAELAFAKMLKDRGVDVQIIKDAVALLVNPTRRAGARRNERDAIDSIGTILQAQGNIARIREIVEDAVSEDARSSAAEFVRRREFGDVIRQLSIRWTTSSNVRKESLSEVQQILTDAVEHTLARGQNRNLGDVLDSLVNYGQGHMPDALVNEVGTVLQGGGEPILEMLAYRLFAYTQDQGRERNRRLQTILRRDDTREQFPIGRNATPLLYPEPTAAPKAETSIAFIAAMTEDQVIKMGSDEKWLSTLSPEEFDAFGKKLEEL